MNHERRPLKDTNRSADIPVVVHLTASRFYGAGTSDAGTRLRAQVDTSIGICDFF